MAKKDRSNLHMEYLGLGTALGLILGMLLNNIAVGLVLGVVVGSGIVSVARRRQN